MIDNNDEAMLFKIDENDLEDFQSYERFFRLTEEECDEPRELDFYRRKPLDDFYPETLLESEEE